MAEIEDFENGKQVPKVVNQRIKSFLHNQLCLMDSVEHYRKKILELALEINVDDDTQSCLLEMGHLMVEIGKLQKELIVNAD